jgi:hypothetical protein
MWRTSKELILFVLVHGSHKFLSIGASTTKAGKVISHIARCHVDRCRMQVLYDKIGAIRPRELVKQGYHVEHVMTLMLWRLEYYLLSQSHRWGHTLHPPTLMLNLPTHAPHRWYLLRYLFSVYNVIYYYLLRDATRPP